MKLTGLGQQFRCSRKGAWSYTPGSFSFVINYLESVMSHLVSFSVTVLAVVAGVYVANKFLGV